MEPRGIYQFEQQMGATTVPSSSVRSKWPILAVVILAVIGSIIGFIMINKGDSPNQIDRFIVSQENVLAVAEAAEQVADDFESKSVIANTIILLKSDLADWNAYRKDKFNQRINPDIDSLRADEKALREKFSEARQNNTIKSVFADSMQAALDKSGDFLAEIKPDNEQLRNLIERSKITHDSLKIQLKN